MLITAFKALSGQLVVIAAMIAGCALCVWFIEGSDAATALIFTTVDGMKAPWVWTFGYGLARFVAGWGRQLPASIDGFLEPGDASAAVVARIEQSTLHRRAIRLTLPVTALGVVLTAAYGIPNSGVGYWMIFVGVCAIYYIAAFLLFHFIEMILAFQGLFDRMQEEDIQFRRVYSPLCLENLTSYLSITTAIGLAAIYAGFRGTLTAGFRFHNESWRMFLSTPLILFLPGTLFYNYYPRYVLRKIVQYRIFRAMDRLSTAVDDVSVQKLLQDMRESSFVNSQILPFLDYKSLPSYLLAVFFVISLAYNHDPAVQAFVRYVVDLGLR